MKKMKKVLSALLLLVLLAGLFPLPSARAADMRTTAVARMDITFKCGCSRIGTGVMVAVNGMLTAGHNLVCHKHNKPLKNCTFYFGPNGKKYHYKYKGSFTFTWYCDFSDGYESENDIGYIVFPKSKKVGKTTGWYASTAASNSKLGGSYCHMYGYNGNRLVNDWDQVKVVSAREISWPISSALKNCAEGGPVYFEGEGSDYPSVVAIYTCYGSNNSKGYARRLTSQLFDDMRSSGVEFN